MGMGRWRGLPFFSPVRALVVLKKERKKTDNPREGWEDGTPPPHRDFKERCVVRYPSPTLGSLPLPISLRSLSPLLAAIFMPPRGRPTLVVLSLVISSSVASFSSASSCDAAACRSLVLAASFAFRRNSVLLAAYPGPSSLSSSPRARTTFLTPTPIICPS